MAMPRSRPRSSVSCEGHLQDVDPVGSENRAWWDGKVDNMQGILKHIYSILFSTLPKIQKPGFPTYNLVYLGCHKKPFFFRVGRGEGIYT